MSNIVVADPSARDRLRAKSILEGADHRVREAESWEDLMGLLLRERVDIVLLDLPLPGVQEEQVAHYLRRRVILFPKVLFFSDRDLVALTTLGRRIGADGVVSKRKGPLELLRKVGRILFREDGEGRLRPPGDPVDVGFGEGNSDLPMLMQSVRPGPVRRALVVDADSRYREMARTHLRRLGYVVHEAESWVTACESLLHYEYALLLIEVRLEEISGAELARMTRSAGHRTKIVFWTALPEPSVRPLCQEVDAGFLAKPPPPVAMRMSQGLPYDGAESESRPPPPSSTAPPRPPGRG